MKQIGIIIALLSFIQLSYCQAENDQKIIQKNNVKSSIQKHCFTNSQSSCSVIYEKYDQRGNIIEWNMGRLGSFRRFVYDKNNNLILKLWVDKSDTTKIDSIIYEYDRYNNLTKQTDIGPINHIIEYENIYDKQNRLIKTFSKSKSNDGKTILRTTTRNWTSFDKIKTEQSQSEILKKDWKGGANNNRKIVYNYDSNQNLIKKVFYQSDTINKIVKYRYDDQNRCIEKREDDPTHAKRVNDMKFSNRKDIKIFTTKTKYNKEGQIDELFTYFSDPCLSLDDHYLYKHHYLENGLIDSVNVFKGDKVMFTIQFEYEYY